MRAIIIAIAVTLIGLLLGGDLVFAQSKRVVTGVPAIDQHLQPPKASDSPENLSACNNPEVDHVNGRRCGYTATREEARASAALGKACRELAGTNEYTIGGTATNGSHSITCTIIYRR